MSVFMDWNILLLLCAAAFAAGFVDAIVGGGGLIQLPAALLLLPQYPVYSVIGSLKIPSFMGTAIAARQYLTKVTIQFRLLAVLSTVAFFASYAGSQVLTTVSNAFMKPVLVVVLAAVALYTFLKKDLGREEAKNLTAATLILRGVMISLVIGFYDGFIGPGAGSFFMLAFVTVMGNSFLAASAYARMVNLATNMGSLTLFIFKGYIIWSLAVPMAIANAAGGYLGAKVALRKGNAFIRIFFLVVVLLILLRFAFDLYFN